MKRRSARRLHFGAKLLDATLHLPSPSCPRIRVCSAQGPTNDRCEVADEGDSTARCAVRAQVFVTACLKTYRWTAHIEKHSRYWFADGNIVLVADNATAFRVHKGILGQRSSVFQGILDIPQPPSEVQVTVEGCPVVHLPDNSEEFALFIGFIYDAWECVTLYLLLYTRLLIMRSYRADDDHPEWHNVKILLQYGDKYDVPEFRREGIRQLEKTFPASVAEWDKVRSGEPWACMSFTWRDFISIAEVARPLNRPDLYAAALYQCCSLTIRELLAGADDEDEPMAPMTGESLRRCLYGRDGMPSVWLEYRKDLFCAPSPPESGGCGSASCEQARFAMDTSVTEDPRSLSTHAYRLLTDDSWDDVFKTAQSGGMCPECLAFYRRRCATKRQKYRDSLEKHFWYVDSACESNSSQISLHQGQLPGINLSLLVRLQTLIISVHTRHNAPRLIIHNLDCTGCTG